jgi:predicted PurR-regulated permease PerM
MQQSTASATDRRAPAEVQASGDVVATGRPRASWPLVVLAIVGVLAAMYAARDVLVPIVFAVLLMLLLRPLLRRMRKLRLPNALSALLLVGAVVGIFVAGIFTLAGQAQTWLAEAPATVERVGKMLPSQSGPLGKLNDTTQAVEDLANPQQAQGDEPLQVEVQSQDTAMALLGVSTHFVAAATIVFVLGYFLLAFSDTLLTQAVAAQSSFTSKRSVVSTVQNVEQGVSRYLLTITVINIGLGAATALVMWLLGIPNPLLWGVLATTANYVPHVGAFVCMLVLFFVGAVTHQSLAGGAAVAGAFIALTTVESYFITPLVLSRSLQLSPVAVIVAILFWGWLWGIGGGLMAAPLLTIMKIVCDQFEWLHPVATILSGEAPAAAAEEGGATAQIAATPAQSAAR